MIGGIDDKEQHLKGASWLFTNMLLLKQTVNESHLLLTYPLITPSSMNIHTYRELHTPLYLYEDLDKVLI